MHRSRKYGADFQCLMCFADALRPRALRDPRRPRLQPTGVKCEQRYLANGPTGAPEDLRPISKQTSRNPAFLCPMGSRRVSPSNEPLAQGDGCSAPPHVQGSLADFVNTKCLALPLVRLKITKSPPIDHDSDATVFTREGARSEAPTVQEPTICGWRAHPFTWSTLSTCKGLPAANSRSKPGDACNSLVVPLSAL